MSKTTNSDYGFGGRILRINLSNGDIYTEPSRKYTERWLGGRLVNTWILLNELKPEVKWSAPENILAFGIGVLVGTLAPAACRVSVDTKSAFTGGIGSANVGGFWGAELKFAGFDHIIITGRAEKPVYIWINDSNVEIKEASDIWGKTTWETERIIRGKHNDERIRIAAIGPAGENLVRGSAIICDRAAAAGGSGCGAVMGSKNLKAIAVRSSGTIAVAEPEKFLDAVDKASAKINAYPGMNELRQKGFYGYRGAEKDTIRWEQGYRKVRNGQDDSWSRDKIAKISSEVMADYRIGTVACFDCPVACKPWMRIENGKYKIQGEGWWMNSVIAFCTTMDNSDPESALFAHSLTNQLGLDMDNAVQVIAWAHECYEKGLITQDDTDGLELEWGNHEVLIKMLEKLAYRDGFGDFLADGAKRAAEKLGKDSWKFAIHLKGQDSLDGVRINKAWGFAVVVSPLGGRHLRGGIGVSLHARDELNSYEGVPEEVFKTQQQKAWQDIVGICSYVYGQELEDWVEMYSAAVGRELTLKEALHVGRQAHNLEKAFNTIHAGFERKDDYPPYRYYNEEVKSGMYKGERLDHEIWENMLDRYYEVQGWDKKTGLQTRQGLTAIGLADVADMIEQVGTVL